jgi:hypothetical protein
MSLKFERRRDGTPLAHFDRFLAVLEYSLIGAKISTEYLTACPVYCKEIVIVKLFNFFIVIFHIYVSLYFILYEKVLYSCLRITRDCNVRCEKGKIRDNEFKIFSIGAVSCLRGFILLI